MTDATIEKRPHEGWCSRRPDDDYGPNTHDGSYLHAQNDGCANFRRDP